MQKVMSGAAWLAWKHSPQTQEFVKFLQDSIAGDQDSWLSGHFGSEKENWQAQGGAFRLAKVVDAIENIRLEDEHGTASQK